MYHIPAIWIFFLLIMFEVVCTSFELWNLCEIKQSSIFHTFGKLLLWLMVCKEKATDFSTRLNWSEIWEVIIRFDDVIQVSVFCYVSPTPSHKSRDISLPEYLVYLGKNLFIFKTNPSKSVEIFCSEKISSAFSNEWNALISRGKSFPKIVVESVWNLCEKKRIYRRDFYGFLMNTKLSLTNFSKFYEVIRPKIPIICLHKRDLWHITPQRNC